MLGWARSRAKKRSASEDHEQVDEVPMDAQSPGGNNDSGAAETPPDVRLLEPLKEDPPNAYSPAQELIKYCQRVDQHKKEMEEAAHLMESLCRENEEKDKFLVELREENAALRKQVEAVTQEKENLDDKLRHQNHKMYDMKSELESLRRSCFELTEEKRERDRLVAEQREDLQAKQKRIKELNKELKDADKESKKMAVVLSRKHSLELEVKDKDAHLKKARDDYAVQLEISGSWTQKARMLEEENKQLRSKMESANAQLSAVHSELENLKREVHKQTVKEEGLQLLVQKRDEEISVWKQTCDAQSQHLKAVAAFATIPIDPAGQSVVQHGQDEVTPHHKMQESAAAAETIIFPMLVLLVARPIYVLSEDVWNQLGCSKLFLLTDRSFLDYLCPLIRSIKKCAILLGIKSSKDQSGVCEKEFYSAPHTQILPTAFPELHLHTSGWPPPSTAILSQFAGRIAQKWYEVGHALGVSTEVANLKQTEQNAERKCLLCLEAWIECVFWQSPCFRLLAMSPSLRLYLKGTYNVMAHLWAFQSRRHV